MADVTDGASGFESAQGYRVLARKYRPASFDDLIGQDAMVRTLSNAFETGRIPQAWMLTGVRGVGKTTTARILARGLNYEGPGGGGPTIRMAEFGAHCRAIVEGRHVDVHEMDAASHTGVSDIREITDAVRYKPMSARYKVTIIDEVHMLSTAAFNALLKTLEEPPEHAKFIFATTEIRKVPVTVLSRCQRFDLRRVDAGLLAAHLAKIAAAEQVRLEADAAALLARAAEGSVRDALSLLDQAIAHGAGAVDAETVRAMLGLVDRLRVFDLLETALRGDAAGALALFDAQYRDGAEPATVIAELAETVHAVTRAKMAPDAPADAPEAEAARIADLANRLSLRALTRAWQLLLKGLGEVQGAPRPVAAAEMLLVRLCHAADLPTPDELVRRLDGAPTPAAAPPAPAPRGAAQGTSALAAAPRAAEPARSPSTADRPALARFEDVVALAVERRDIPFKLALERQLHLVRFAPGVLEFRPAEGAPAGLAGEIARKLLDWTGERWMVAVSSEDGAPTLQAQAEARRLGLVDDVRGHPGVAAVLARFPGAEIVDVRVNRPEPEAPDPLPPDPADDDA
jgi:DNA polymerase-3 subunit gamma/tau